MDTQEIVAAVLGCPSTGEFRLIDLDHDEIPLPDAEAVELHNRGWFFVGTLGYVNGTFAARVADGADPRDGSLMLAASLEFSRFVQDKLSPKTDDSGCVDWLKNLWSLPDTREN